MGVITSLGAARRRLQGCTKLLYNLSVLIRPPMNPSDLAKLLSRKDELETLLGKFEESGCSFLACLWASEWQENPYSESRTWWNTRKLQEVNQQIDQYRQSETAQVNQRAGEALERAARAEENLAGASERAANAQKKAAQLKLVEWRMKNLTARLKIEALLAPRRVSSAQEEKMREES